MEILPDIAANAPFLVELRRQFHAEPEIGMEEHRTAARVAEQLRVWGVEVHAGVGKTGVVGVVQGAGPGGSVGLRADMDALPMEEASAAPHRSRRAGAHHGCGHDGHTVMLLGAAAHLAATRAFPGRVVLVFQPGEEGAGGARAMLEDGLFRRFPCDEIYALHNWPGAPLGRVSARRGVAMAAADTFDVTLTGLGAHGAQPHLARDPVIAAAALAQALQTVVSRSIDPLQPAILSVTQIHAGSAYNVIPESARLGGTIRTFDPAVRALVADRVRALAAGIAAAHGLTVEVAIQARFPALRNADAQLDAALEIAQAVVGPERVERDAEPRTGSEDFADMLEAVPGAYLFLGAGDGPGLHSPRYDFNDALLPIGASLLARIAEERARTLAAKR